MAFSSPAEVCMDRTVELREDERPPRHQSPDVEEFFDVEKTAEWIRDNNYQKVCLQLPDSLLGDGVALCRRLKALLGKELYLLADTTYNSCCVDEVAARHVNSDAIVHYGHSCLAPTDFPVFYVYPKAALDVDHAVKTLGQVDGADVVLFYDVSLEHLRESLCQKFFEAFPQLCIGVLPKGPPTKRTVFGRSLIDRDGTERDMDACHDSQLVFLGPEGPTLFNLAVCSKAKNLYHLDTRSGAMAPYSQSQWFKRRRYLIEKCKDAASVGILVCTLSVRNYNAIIQRMKRLVLSRGKKCYTLTVGKPNVAKLANLSEIQLFVLVACPENELYSCKDFLSPIIYPYELELALNPHRDQYDTDYSTDFNDLLPEGCNHRVVDDNGSSHPPDVSLISGNLRNVSVSSLDKSDLKNMDGRLEAVRKEDWAVAELGIGKAISDRSWKGLEQNLGNTKAELAAVGRKGIASGYEGESF